MSAIDLETPSAPVSGRVGSPATPASRSQGPLTAAVISLGVSVVLGWFATVVGAVMILVGYLRVDSSDSLAEQFAYFSSACIGGLALIGLGGLAVLSRQHADARRAVEEIRRRVRSEPATSDVRSDRTDAKAGASVVVVDGSSTYHLDDCVFVAGRPGVRRASSHCSELDAMRPCQVCAPPPR